MKRREVVVYCVLVAVRVVMCFAHGYVHPDEWFQSAEVTAPAAIGVAAFVPWEYTPAAAVRSPAVATLVTGIPLRIAGAVFSV
jgi:phosphatidylinositol glycan class Z